MPVILSSLIRLIIRTKPQDGRTKI